MLLVHSIWLSCTGLTEERGVGCLWSVGGQESEFLWNSSVQDFGCSSSRSHFCAQHKICRHPKLGIKWAAFTSFKKKKGVKQSLWSRDVTTSSTALFFYLVFQVQKLHALKKKKKKINCWKPLFCCSACFISFCLATSTPAVLTTKNCPFFCPAGLSP